jgi:hypothetical protein
VLTFIVLAFISGGLSRRDDPNRFTFISFAMAYHQNAGFVTKTKHEKAIFVI